MSRLIDKVRAHWEAQDGLAMPVVLLALVVMTTIAVAALVTTSDEQKSARAVREAGLAFYDAEAGLWESWANWPADSVVSAIEQGDSLDLGWKSLDNGADYRGKIYRWGPSTFGLRVESRGAGPFGGQQWLSLLVNHEASWGIGRCCDSAALVDGDVDLRGSLDNIDGHDAHPPGWEAAGVCTNGLEDGPGLVMKDMTQLPNDGTIDGVPPQIEDTTISETTFTEFGADKTWADLKAQANHTVSQYDVWPAPSYLPNGDCDTSDRFNWGSPDPNDACFDYFPIILIQDQVHAEDTYGQGILILDWDEVNNLGSEIDLEDGMVYNGIILGKGCLEIQRGATLNGAAFMDGNYFNADLCSPDKVLDLNADGNLQYNLRDRAGDHGCRPGGLRRGGWRLLAPGDTRVRAASTVEARGRSRGRSRGHRQRPSRCARGTACKDGAWLIMDPLPVGSCLESDQTFHYHYRLSNKRGSGC